LDNLTLILLEWYKGRLSMDVLPNNIPVYRVSIAMIKHAAFGHKSADTNIIMDSMSFHKQIQNCTWKKCLKRLVMDSVTRRVMSAGFVG
jgi:hypothetical protein